MLMNNKFKEQTLNGNPTGNYRCQLFASRALNMSCYFSQSARSIESRRVVNKSNYACMFSSARELHVPQFSPAIGRIIQEWAHGKLPGQFSYQEEILHSIPYHDQSSGAWGGGERGGGDERHGYEQGGGGGTSGWYQDDKWSTAAFGGWRLWVHGHVYPTLFR